MFLIIKVNVPIDLRLFRVHRNRYRPVELKKNYRGGGLPAYEKCRSLKVGCLAKKNCKLKLSAMTRNTFNIRRGR